MKKLKDKKKIVKAKEYIGKTIRVFLSYSTEDKSLAGFIKSFLEWYGLEVFVAHEDIEPSSEWQEAIIQNLESTDIFIPIITETFSLSKWTDQESGMALAKNKFILPLTVGSYIPYGFINKYQALKLKTGDVDSFEESCQKIIDILKKDERFSSALLDSFIKTLPGVLSYKQADKKFLFISGFESFSPGQVDEFLKYSNQNPQIWGSWEYNKSSKSFIINLIKRYKKTIDEDLINLLNDKI